VRSDQAPPVLVLFQPVPAVHTSSLARRCAVRFAGAQPLHRADSLRLPLMSNVRCSNMANATSRQGLKLAAALAVVLAIVFVGFGGFSRGYSLESVVLLAGSGAFIGAIAAPDCEPKWFRYPTLWQVGFGIAGFVALAAHLGATGEGYAFATLVGAFVGYLAPFWTKHIQVP